MRKKCNDLIKTHSHHISTAQGKQIALREMFTSFTLSAELPENAPDDVDELERQLHCYEIRQSLYEQWIQRYSFLIEKENNLCEKIKNDIDVNSLKDLECTLDLHKERERWNAKRVSIDESVDYEITVSEIIADIEYVEKYNELTQRLDKLDYFPDELKQICEEINHLESLCEGMYQCPVCDTSLELRNNKLFKSTGDNQEIIDSKQKEKHLKELYKRKTQLDANASVASCILVEKIQLEDDLPEESLEELRTMKEEWERFARIAKEQQEIQQQISVLDEQLQTKLSVSECTELVSEIRNQIMWKDELSKIQSDIQHLETAPRYEDNSDYIKTLKKQVSEYKETQRCRQYFTQLQDAENELAKAEKRHTAAQKLKVIISQAQTEVVRSTIRRIGELANAYATQIFNDPITIRMNVDGNENGKSSINLEILLKGIECTFGMLSGGEQARMNLAFVLALFNTFHGEILLLDEITSQLNQELAEHVVDIIQKVTQGKVILVAHQLVEGNFDQVISL